MSTALDGWDLVIDVVDVPGNETTQTVETLLESAKRAAKPLRDPGLDRKIGEAIEHVKTKANPRTG